MSSLKDKLTSIKGKYLVIIATVCLAIAVGTAIYCGVKGFY